MTFSLHQERIWEGIWGNGDGVKVDRVGKFSEILGRVHWAKAKIDYKAWYHPRCRNGGSRVTLVLHMNSYIGYIAVA